LEKRNFDSLEKRNFDSLEKRNFDSFHDTVNSPGDTQFGNHWFKSFLDFGGYIHEIENKPYKM
jgi:hypothetical protein